MKCNSKFMFAAEIEKDEKKEKKEQRCVDQE